MAQALMVPSILPPPSVPRNLAVSSHTWTSSSADSGLLTDNDMVEERDEFVQEYNRLATKYGIRILISDDYEDAPPNTPHPEKKKWYSRRQMSSSRTASSKAICRKSSMGDLSLHLHHVRRDQLKDETLQGLVRLCGKSILYLPSEYTPWGLVVPTCIRATAQYLVQHAPQTRGVFRVPGSVRVVNALYDYFSPDHEGGGTISGTVRSPNLPSHIEFGIHEVASTFKKLLSGLPGGILGSLSLFDALVAIHSQLNGGPDMKRTKETKLRARLIALAVGTLRSHFQRELVCAVFGLLCLIGRAAETAAREDDRGRPLPTSDLMGYNALGIVFGPLLVGELIDNYAMKVAAPNAGLILLPLTPQGPSKKQHRRSKGGRSVSEGKGRPSPSSASSPPFTIDKIRVANSIAEMMIANWREVVRNLKSGEIIRRHPQKEGVEPWILQPCVFEPGPGSGENLKQPLLSTDDLGNLDKLTTKKSYDDLQQGVDGTLAVKKQRSKSTLNSRLFGRKKQSAILTPIAATAPFLPAHPQMPTSDLSSTLASTSTSTSNYSPAEGTNQTLGRHQHHTGGNHFGSATAPASMIPNPIHPIHPIYPIRVHRHHEAGSLVPQLPSSSDHHYRHHHHHDHHNLRQDLGPHTLPAQDQSMRTIHYSSSIPKPQGFSGLGEHVVRGDPLETDTRPTAAAEGSSDQTILNQRTAVLREMSGQGGVSPPAAKGPVILPPPPSIALYKNDRNRGNTGRSGNTIIFTDDEDVGTLRERGSPTRLTADSHPRAAAAAVAARKHATNDRSEGEARRFPLTRASGAAVPDSLLQRGNPREAKVPSPATRPKAVHKGPSDEVPEPKKKTTASAGTVKAMAAMFDSVAKDGTPSRGHMHAVHPDPPSGTTAAVATAAAARAAPVRLQGGGGAVLTEYVRNETPPGSSTRRSPRSSRSWKSGDDDGAGRKSLDGPPPSLMPPHHPGQTARKPSATPHSTSRVNPHQTQPSAPTIRIQPRRGFSPGNSSSASTGGQRTIKAKVVIGRAPPPAGPLGGLGTMVAPRDDEPDVARHLRFSRPVADPTAAAAEADDPSTVRHGLDGVPNSEWITRMSIPTAGLLPVVAATHSGAPKAPPARPGSPSNLAGKTATMDGGPRSRSPSPGTTSSTLLLHAQIRTLQRQLANRTEECSRLRAGLAALRAVVSDGPISSSGSSSTGGKVAADSHLGSLSEQLRRARRDVKVWRDRAESAERRVAAHERFAVQKAEAVAAAAAAVTRKSREEDEEEQSVPASSPWPPPGLRRSGARRRAGGTDVTVVAGAAAPYGRRAEVSEGFGSGLRGRMILRGMDGARSGCDGGGRGGDGHEDGCSWPLGEVASQPVDDNEGDTDSGAKATSTCDSASLRSGETVLRNGRLVSGKSDDE